MNDTRKRILDILGAIRRPGMDNVIGYLVGSTYFTAGCHGHHRYRGGLADHSLEVYDRVMASGGGIPQESAAIASLLHDICKAHRADSEWIHGHGRRSARILTDICRLSMSEEERSAILLHMHPHADAIRHSRLGTAVCRADKRSAASCGR